MRTNLLYLSLLFTASQDSNYSDISDDFVHLRILDFTSLAGVQFGGRVGGCQSIAMTQVFT